VAVSIEIMLALLRLLDVEAQTTLDPEKRRLMISVGAYCAKCYCCTLHGNEGFMMDLAGLRNHIDKGRTGPLPHVMTPLLGRFKSEEGKRFHLLLSVPVTGSGIQLQNWLERLIQVGEEKGRASGPAFADKSGDVASP
jgi:hypothetical protein